MIKGFKEAIEELTKMAELCEKLKISSLSDFNIYDGERLELTHWVTDVDKEKAKEVMKAFGKHKANKTYGHGNVNWEVDNLILHGVSECKIIGYNEKIVPKHTEKIPIYDCPNGEKTVKVDGGRKPK